MTPRKTIPVSAVLAAFSDVDNCVRQKLDPQVTIGYVWAKFADLAVLCGSPRPVAPWDEERP